MIVTIGFALAAALANAVHLMTQHAASTGVTAKERGWKLVSFLIRQPLWLLGWAAAAAGFAFQAVALHTGPLSIVQPVLVTELVLLAAVAVPLGLLVGTGFATAILGAVNTETVRLPLILTASNYAFAVMVVCIASTFSALVVLRKLHQLDLVGALKAPE